LSLALILEIQTLMLIYWFCPSLKIQCEYW